MAIKFGTDGWRALIAEDYTFDNVRICSQAVCEYMKARNINDNGLIIGYDTRFGSDRFATAAAEVAAANGIPVVLCDRFSPTPVVSHNLVNRECGAGIVITASHNPGEWNGFKFKPGYGGSASPEIVEELEGYLSTLEKSGEFLRIPASEAIKGGLIEMINPEPSYMNHVAGMVGLQEIRNAGLNVVVDSMHGAGSGYLARLLEGGNTRVSEIRSNVNPSFPNMIQPEPIDRNLGPLKSAVGDMNGDIGIATDGDADRLGVIDEDGNYISTLHTFALICQHLIEGLGMEGALVRSITMTSMIDKLGEIHGIPVLDTPVGFKYLGPVMMEENAVAAGEESGGYAFRGHIPERDGILSALMLLDMMVKTGKNPGELLIDLEEKVGPHFYNRLDLGFQEDQRERIIQNIESTEPKCIANIPVSKIDTRDGFRYVLENGSWALIRFSGTEPLIRIYAEAGSAETVDALLKECCHIAGV